MLAEAFGQREMRSKLSSQGFALRSSSTRYYRRGADSLLTQKREPISATVRPPGIVSQWAYPGVFLISDSCWAQTVIIPLSHSAYASSHSIWQLACTLRRKSSTKARKTSRSATSGETDSLKNIKLFPSTEIHRWRG